MPKVKKSKVVAEKVVEKPVEAVSAPVAVAEPPKVETKAEYRARVTPCWCRTTRNKDLFVTFSRKHKRKGFAVTCKDCKSVIYEA